MGEDLQVTFHFDTTIEGIKQYLEDTRGISRHRQQIRPLFKKAGNRIIPPEKEGWTLKRLGFEDDTVVTVEPTLPGNNSNSISLNLKHK